MKETVRNAGFHSKCQRCGRESVTTLCSKCSPCLPSGKVATNMFRGYIKEVTVSGCNVLVNGVVKCTEATHELAKKMAPIVERRLAIQNAGARRLLVGANQ